MKRKFTRFSIAGIGIVSTIIASTFTHLVDLVIVIKSFGLVLPPIVLFIWFTKGDAIGIIFSIGLTSVLVVGFALNGFIRPELSFIAIFGCVCHTLLLPLHVVVREPYGYETIARRSSYVKLLYRLHP